MSCASDIESQQLCWEFEDLWHRLFFSPVVPKSLSLLKPYITQDIRNDHSLMLSK